MDHLGRPLIPDLILPGTATHVGTDDESEAEDPEADTDALQDLQTIESVVSWPFRV